MPVNPPIPLDAFTSFTLAIVLLFMGKETIRRVGFLRKYSIPEPVVGGLLCVTIVSAIYIFFGREIHFTLEARNALLLYFFACIGLTSDIRMLKTGGKPLIVLTLLAGTFIVLQNGLGMAVATFFGLKPQTGLMTGSISLTGGIGTTLAWAPDFVKRLGISDAMELGVASNMVGLIAACCIGGPIAGYLIRRHHLQASSNARVVVGSVNEHENLPLDYYSILRSWLWMNVALLVGHHIINLLHAQGLNLPDFVGALLAGIALRNLLPFVKSDNYLWKVTESRRAFALISDICLGMFLTMALMDLRPWELKGSLPFLSTVLILQITLAIAFTVLVVYRFMGKDYEAAVICSGFGGISLGSTATAVANMTAVSHEYGAANRAFLVVPLVCGFSVDLINALVINFMSR